MMDDSKQYFQFVQMYSLNKGIQCFGNKVWDAAFGEMKQLNDREVLNQRKTQALESLIFLVEKKNNTIKGRTCANGTVQREFVSREDATSPTVPTESIILTATIEPEEGRHIMTIDILNAFVQTELDLKKEKKL
jgi:hypothetical protein